MTYTIYTDGSCKPSNPGFAGCGIVIVDDNNIICEKIAHYIGEGTNNIAELFAINIALKWLKNNSDTWESHIIYTDSNYAVGLLTKNWKASKNQELVAELRKSLELFPNCKIQWVKGHNNDKYNEMADLLANSAVDSRV